MALCVVVWYAMSLLGQVDQYLLTHVSPGYNSLKTHVVVVCLHSFYIFSIYILLIN